MGGVSNTTLRPTEQQRVAQHRITRTPILYSTKLLDPQREIGQFAPASFAPFLNFSTPAANLDTVPARIIATVPNMEAVDNPSTELRDVLAHEAIHSILSKVSGGSTPTTNDNAWRAMASIPQREGVATMLARIKQRGYEQSHLANEAFARVGAIPGQLPTQVEGMDLDGLVGHLVKWLNAKGGPQPAEEFARVVASRPKE